MTQNILLDSPSFFSGDALRTVIPVSFLLCWPRSSTNLKCEIRIITLCSPCSPGVLFVFAAGFFVVVVWLGVCFWGKGMFVLLLHLHGKVLTSKIMIANSFRSYQKTDENSEARFLYQALLCQALPIFLSKIWRRKKPEILTTKSPKEAKVSHSHVIY